MPASAQWRQFCRLGPACTLETADAAEAAAPTLQMIVKVCHAGQDQAGQARAGLLHLVDPTWVLYVLLLVGSAFRGAVSPVSLLYGFLCNVATLSVPVKRKTTLVVAIMSMALLGHGNTIIIQQV